MTPRPGPASKPTSAGTWTRCRVECATLPAASPTRIRSLRPARGPSRRRAGCSTPRPLALTRQDEGELAVTAYTADGTPVAWAGRPSELPPDRLAGDEAWFIAPGALGLRLVYVTPVTQPGNRRVGTMAAERAIGTSFPTRIAPVSIDLPFEGGRTTPDASAFDVTAPSGQRLLTARLDPAELARARDRWRRATLSLTLVAIALDARGDGGAAPRLAEWGRASAGLPAPLRICRRRPPHRARDHRRPPRPAPRVACRLVQLAALLERGVRLLAAAAAARPRRSTSCSRRSPPARWSHSACSPSKPPRVTLWHVRRPLTTADARHRVSRDTARRRRRAGRALPGPPGVAARHDCQHDARPAALLAASVGHATHRAPARLHRLARDGARLRRADHPAGAESGGSSRAGNWGLRAVAIGAVGAAARDLADHGRHAAAPRSSRCWSRWRRPSRSRCMPPV